MNSLDALGDTDLLPINYVPIHQKYWVLKELLDFARSALSPLRTWAVPGQAYTARELIGEGTWEDLSTAEKRLVGSVISHLVAIGELPLVRLPKLRYWHSNTYRLMLAASEGRGAVDLACGVRMTWAPVPVAEAVHAGCGR